MNKNINSHIDSNHLLMHENLKIMNDINIQRELNRTIKISLQADIGKIRRYAQRHSNPTELSMNESNSNNNNNNNTKKMINNNNNLSINDNSINESIIEDYKLVKNDILLEPSDLLERNRQKILAMKATIIELENIHKVNDITETILPKIEANTTLEKDNSTPFMTQSNPQLLLPPIAK